MEKKILFIGGSPCSGKSTVAQIISEKYEAFYFKADDYLEEFVSAALKDGKPLCTKVVNMSSEELWMRTPALQNKEEFEIYQELSDYIFARLNKIESSLIITEAAAYTPEIMKKRNYSDYLCIIPTPAFQVENYRRREWVSSVLAECKDKEKAFDNWMQRDILFAIQVKRECECNGIPLWITDKRKSINDTLEWVEKTFKL